MPGLICIAKPLDFNTFVPMVRRLADGGVVHSEKGAGWSHHTAAKRGVFGKATALAGRGTKTVHSTGGSNPAHPLAMQRCAKCATVCSWLL